MDAGPLSGERKNTKCTHEAMIAARPRGSGPFRLAAAVTGRLYRGGSFNRYDGGRPNAG